MKAIALLPLISATLLGACVDQDDASADRDQDRDQDQDQGGVSQDTDGPCKQGKMQVIERLFPQISAKENTYFSLATDSDAGRDVPFWRAVVKIADSGPSGSFTIPFVAGDRIVGLAVDAYGDQAGKGIKAIRVKYQPTTTDSVMTLASGSDTGRKPEWGTASVNEPFTATDLAPTGLLWVSLEGVAPGYRLGFATATFERTCEQ